MSSHITPSPVVCDIAPDHQEAEKVYFIAAVGTSLVKVGHSTDVRKRLAKLSHLSPVTLVLLGTIPGGESEERRLHDLLGDYRHHGEWFRRCQMLDEIIAAIESPADMLRVYRRRNLYFQEYLDELHVPQRKRLNKPLPEPRYGWRRGEFCRLN